MYLIYVCIPFFKWTTLCFQTLPNDVTLLCCHVTCTTQWFTSGNPILRENLTFYKVKDNKKFYIHLVTNNCCSQYDLDKLDQWQRIKKTLLAISGGMSCFVVIWFIAFQEYFAFDKL